MQLPTYQVTPVSVVHCYTFSVFAHLVRMEDAKADILLHLLQQRLNLERDIEKIIKVFSNHCKFLESSKKFYDSRKYFAKSGRQRSC